eukprot:gene13655-9782_t
MKQEYVGCKKLDNVDQISPSIAPSEFFSKYVASRTPVVFNGFITDAEWKVSKESWSYDNLIRRTPDDMTVKIEYRDNDADRFGLGKEKTVPFHEFITDIANDATNLYMTTQELEYDLEDQPEIISAPLTALQQDFPLIPSIFGNLVISNINLWIGRSSSWTTSGLHHDYHDNLYIMLKGQKQITLISPAFTEDLYTEGEMLFIPAGWFHEVKSQGSEGHIAFNYWFHPPDQLDNFDKPYSSDFWPSVLQSKLLNSK